MHKNREALIFRGILFVLSLVIAVTNSELITPALFYNFWFFRVYHAVWLAIFIVLIKEMLPQFSSRIDNGKMFAKYYAENKIKPSDRKRKLATYTRKANMGAIKSALLWLCIMAAVGAVFGASHYMGVFGVNVIIAVLLFLIFLDEIWISVWCPFRNWLIKNKCCNTCRINDWGFFMLLSPLVFIPSFWTYSLILLALAIAIQWEYLHWKHPERFFELYNANLMCKNCKSVRANCIKK